MRNRGRSRKGGRLVAATGAPLGPDAAHTILTVVDDGSGNALFTTAAAHGLIGGETVVISGGSNAAYNAGAQSVDAVPTTTSWITGGGYQGDSTGGSWALL